MTTTLDMQNQKTNTKKHKKTTEYQSPIVSALAEELAAGFENPEKISGRCQFDFVTESEESHCLSVCFDDVNLVMTSDPLMDKDAYIRMPLHVAEKIVTNVEGVDYRDPDIIGHMEMSGNLHLVNHLAKALVKPSKMTQHTFHDATNTYREAYASKAIVYLDSPTELEILETIEQKIPFIIRNPPTNTPHHAWSLDKLKESYGDVLLRVRSTTVKETVAEFVDKMSLVQNQKAADVIEGHTKVYTEGCSLPWQMREDFLPHYFTTHDFSAPQIWLGCVPVDAPASSLHRDPLDGFLYQLIGRKKVILFSPDQASLLYPMKAYNNYQPCWVKPETPNFKDFPLFKKAKSLEVVLHPGEILIQPAGWFHAVYCLDSPTFSVSYFLQHPVGVTPFD
ncbi:cupin-like domain-containing protein [Marinomonas sp. 2405UD68-3]|uniref:cupin-like domain-containing protein n=1 Tax=Marinomonas sp. 2405UD68-3 TaxID=3391835 RepID=UPI0039C907DA